MRSAVPDDDEKTQLVMKRLAELRRKRTLDDTQTTNGAHRRDRGSRPSTHHIPPLSQSPRPEPPLTGPVLTPLEAGGMRRGRRSESCIELWCGRTVRKDVLIGNLTTEALKLLLSIASLCPDSARCPMRYAAPWRSSGLQTTPSRCKKSLTASVYIYRVVFSIACVGFTRTRQGRYLPQ
jgi:hypothetical protein